MPIAFAARCATCALAFLVASCAAPPLTAPSASGKPASEVTRLVAASDAKLFPCNIFEVKGGTGADDLGNMNRPEVTLAPGRYRVKMKCASAYHVFSPSVEVVARAGKSYRLTGYLLDDSITLFTMKMGIKVTEQSL